MRNKLILGTAQLGMMYGINSISKPSSVEVSKILSKAWENDISSLDTAPSYGDAMVQIGSYHQLNPDHRFSINSKIIVDRSLEEIEHQLYADLEVLKVDSYDTILLHRFTDLRDTAVMDKMGSIRDTGVFKHLGVSIYTRSQFSSAIANEHISVIQFPYNLLDNDAVKGDLIYSAKERDILLQARSVFLQGLLFKVPQKLDPYFKSLTEALQSLKDLSRAHSLTVMHMALNYVLHNKYIDSVIMGVDNSSQLKSNCSSVLQKFSPSLVMQISEILPPDIELLNPTNWPE